MKTICYVTSNPGKFAEAEHYIKRCVPGITLERVDLDIPEIQSLDVAAIATAKARYAWDKIRRPLFIDDGGIYFNRWNQFPGALSKFVAQSLGVDGISRLIDEGDTGYFLLYLAYVDEQGNEHLFEGRCDGNLVKRPVGDFDPNLPFRAIFKPEGQDLTYEQMAHNPLYEQYFHRIRALNKLVEWLVKQG